MLYDDMKTRIVEAGERKNLTGRLPDYQQHIDRLRTEFSGCTELEYHHAVLTVSIRRKLNLEKDRGAFITLWHYEADFLCERLSMRWLVSACDTIADVWLGKAQPALAMAGAMFVNTVKLYETERRLTGAHRVDQTARPFDLFDGMTSFAVGGGDMIANLYARMSAVAEDEPPAGKIVRELLKRIKAEDTVFRRFLELQAPNAPKW